MSEDRLLRDHIDRLLRVHSPYATFEAYMAGTVSCVLTGLVCVGLSGLLSPVQPKAAPKANVVTNDGIVTVPLDNMSNLKIWGYDGIHHSKDGQEILASLAKEPTTILTPLQASQATLAYNVSRNQQALAGMVRSTAIICVISITVGFFSGSMVYHSSMRAEEERLAARYRVRQ